MEQEITDIELGEVNLSNPQNANSLIADDDSISALRSSSAIVFQKNHSVTKIVKRNSEAMITLAIELVESPMFKFSSGL